MNGELNKKNPNKKLKAIMLFTLLVAMVGIATSLQGITCQDCLIDISYPFQYSRALDVWYTAEESRIIYLSYYVNSTGEYSIDLQLRQNDTDPFPQDIIVVLDSGSINYVGSTELIIPKDSQYKISMINAEINSWYESTITSATVNTSTNITALQNNDTVDRAYVNTTFLKLSGGSMVDGADINNVDYVNFTGWLHSDNVQSLLQIKEGSFGSTRADGVNYTYFGLNLIHNGTGWQLLNTSDTGVIFLFGGSAPAGSNSFVVYQTQTAGSYDFAPLFGSNYLTPGEVAFGGYQPTAGIQLDVQGLGTIRAANLSGAGNAYPVTSDANGKLQVNRSAGAGITMKSPDGNSWCLTVTNGGTTLATSGVCP